MKNQILFIQGGGEDGYKADQPLVHSLRNALGSEFQVIYPPMPDDEAIMEIANNWLNAIDQAISGMPTDLIIVAHSLGASLILKYLSEYTVPSKVKGIFLLAAPFWSGEKDWMEPLKLRADVAEHLPEDIPLYLYHCSDDEEVPVTHFNRYKDLLPQAHFLEIAIGGHQFNHDLAMVARDILQSGNSATDDRKLLTANPYGSHLFSPATLRAASLLLTASFW